MRIAYLILLLPMAAAAQVYKWTDSQGNTHYSDKPQNGSEEFKVPEPTIYKSMPLEKQLEILKRPTSKPETFTGYKSLEITSPKPGQTFRQDADNITLNSQLDPPLQQGLGHRLQYFLNGEPLGEQTTQPGIRLPALTRGSHSLGVQVLGTDGEVLISSTSMQIHFRQFSKNFKKP